MDPRILPLHARIEREHWWFVARRQIVRDLLASVEPPGPDRRLLDLGCGTGGNLSAFCGDYRGLGVEVDPDAVSFAAAAYPGCEFVQGSIYDPGSWGLVSLVDACLILDVLEHLDEPRTAVSNAVEWLRPGGHLLVTVPADPRLWSRHDRRHEHRCRYTASSLADLFESEPVEQVLLSHFNARLYPLIRLWRTLQNRFRIGENTSAAGDLRMPSRPVNRVLERVFAGEGGRLRAALHGRREPYSAGVSLLAIYRRLGGPA